MRNKNNPEQSWPISAVLVKNADSLALSPVWVGLGKLGFKPAPEHACHRSLRNPKGSGRVGRREGRWEGGWNRSGDRCLGSNSRGQSQPGTPLPRGPQQDPTAPSPQSPHPLWPQSFLESWPVGARISAPSIEQMDLQRSSCPSFHLFDENSISPPPEVLAGSRVEDNL